MENNIQHPDYWSFQYQSGKTGWDMGYVSPPIKNYIDQLTNKKLVVLIPGAGRGWEVGYMADKGFTHVHYLDFSPEAANIFKLSHPAFPDSKIHIEDFFSHHGKYDLIFEQTFFSSLVPVNRLKYVEKMLKLLNPGGKLCGLLFNHEFPHAGPPYGGTRKEYLQLFEPSFKTIVFETAYNSIKPRAQREIFCVFQRK